MPTHKITRQVQVGGKTLKGEISVVSPMGVTLDDGGSQVATQNATTQFMVGIDVSAVKSFFLMSDKNLTLKTNSTGSPANTIALVANVPYEWHEGDYNVFLLTTDVTSMYFVNAGAQDAHVYMECGVDPTP